MKKSNIQRVELIINIGDTSYKVCSMNFDMKENQFYYHFAYQETIKDQLWSYNEQKTTGRPDHISWHQNGQAHLRLKDDKIILGGRFTTGAFLPFVSETITPLLVHSVYLIQGKYSLPTISPGDKQNQIHIDYQEILQSSHPKPFSVILFLSPECMNMERVLNSFWCDINDCNSQVKKRWRGSLLLREGFKSGCILAWQGWTINCVVTDLILPILPNCRPFDFFQAFAYTDLQPILRDFLIQRSKQLGNKSDSSFLSAFLRNCWRTLLKIRFMLKEWYQALS
jgi:hypothetical protein